MDAITIILHVNSPLMPLLTSMSTRFGKELKQQSFLINKSKNEQKESENKGGKRTSCRIGPKASERS